MMFPAYQQHETLDTIVPLMFRMLTGITQREYLHNQSVLGLRLVLLL